MLRVRCCARDHLEVDLQRASLNTKADIHLLRQDACSKCSRSPYCISLVYVPDPDRSLNDAGTVEGTTEGAEDAEALAVDDEAEEVELELAGAGTELAEEGEG